MYICCISILIYRSLTIRKQDNVAKKSFNTISTWLGLFGLISVLLIFVNFYQAMFNGQSDLVNIRGLNGLFTQQTFVWLLVAIVGAHAIVVISSFSLRTYF